MKSYRQIVEEAKTEIPEVTVAEVNSEQDKESDFVLLDVRDEDEYRAGYIPNAVHVTRGMLEFRLRTIFRIETKKLSFTVRQDSALSSLPNPYAKWVTPILSLLRADIAIGRQRVTRLHKINR